MPSALIECPGHALNAPDRPPLPREAVPSHQRAIIYKCPLLTQCIALHLLLSCRLQLVPSIRLFQLLKQYIEILLGRLDMLKYGRVSCTDRS